MSGKRKLGLVETPKGRVTHATVSIHDLIPHEKNYNKHTPEQLAELKASLDRFQQVDDVIVRALPDGKYQIIAHEGVTTAAIQLIESGDCPQFEEWNVTIVPPSWTDLDVEGYMVASNELPRKSVSDESQLVELLQSQQDAGFDLAALGSDDESLRQMLEALGDEYVGDGEQEGDGPEDELPEEVETRAKVGDIWQLGRHKIACLNSCDPATYKTFLAGVDVKCVWSDPPYGINVVDTNVSVGGGEEYDYPFGGVVKGQTGQNGPFASKSFGSNAKQKSRVGHFGQLADNVAKAGKYYPVIGDDSTDTAITCYRLCADMWPKALQVWWGANNYAQELPPSTCWIVWDKENTGDFADAELAWCSAKTAVRIFKHMWNGMLKDSEHGQRRVHPTQKPIKLAEWAFEKYGSDGDIIFDPFLGSGMSLIAAEDLERIVYGCELSPEYIDVMIARWEAKTGLTATLLERVEVPHA